MLKFDKPWHQQIADRTSSKEYQTATVKIVDPSLVDSEYNYDTGKWETTDDGTIYEGQARIIGVRWGVFSGGEGQANSKTISAIRVQTPRENEDGPTFIRVKKGCTMTVTSAPYNPVLESFMFVSTSDMQGSSSATRTFEFSLDSDVEIK